MASAPELLTVMGNDARLLLDARVNIAQAPGQDVSCAVVETSRARSCVAGAILSEVRRWRAGLIVFGSQGSSAMPELIVHAAKSPA